MRESRDVLTSEEAPEYLQVDRESIYSCIHQGKLVAFKEGRAHGTPRWSVELLWAAKTRRDVRPRDYTGTEVAETIDADRLHEEARAIADRLCKVESRSQAAQSSQE